MTFHRWLSLAARLIIGAGVTLMIFVLLYRFVPVPGTTLMGWRVLQQEDLRYQWVPLTEMSPHLVRAAIAAEDVKFCKHVGFDFGEMKAAYEDFRAGKGLRGASTISQQTAKNAFLWPGRDPFRKALEVGFTVPMEILYPKRRIMEVYLNVAEWGDGLFGAEAAAQRRFGKPAADLTPREAALLASVLPSPNGWRVDPPGPYVKKRANTVRARMRSVQSQGLDACALPRR